LFDDPFVGEMSYEDSNAKAFPFGKIVDGMIKPEKSKDAIQIIVEVVRQR
jgi:hypothetical protein